MRPRLLGHLRDMLAEKEQDITALRSRLRASEEVKGDALSRLEQLEARLCNLPPGGTGNPSRETAALAPETSVATGIAAHVEVAERLQASQRLAEQLREQLAIANAGR